MAYHQQYPQYVKERLATMYNKKRHSRKILLVKNDIKDEANLCNEIYMICMNFDCACIMCWSDEEAAQYLLTFKQYQQKTDTML